MSPGRQDESSPWYHGPLTRQESERRLLNLGGDGAFLVRKRGEEAKPYALSLLYREKVYHLQVRKDAAMRLVVGRVRTAGQPQPSFLCLDHLIRFYSTHPLHLLSRNGSDNTNNDNDINSNNTGNGNNIVASALLTYPCVKPAG